MRYATFNDQIKQFHGNKARFDVGREWYALYPESNAIDLKPSEERRAQGKFQLRHAEPLRNFVECIGSRKQPNAPVEAGQATNIVLSMAMDSYRAGRRLRWNAADAPGGGLIRARASCNAFSRVRGGAILGRRSWQAHSRSEAAVDGGPDLCGRQGPGAAHVPDSARVADIFGGPSQADSRRGGLSWRGAEVAQRAAAGGVAGDHSRRIRLRDPQGSHRGRAGDVGRRPAVSSAANSRARFRRCSM